MSLLSSSFSSPHLSHTNTWRGKGVSPTHTAWNESGGGEWSEENPGVAAGMRENDTEAGKTMDVPCICPLSQEELEPKEREDNSGRIFCHCFCRKSEFTITIEKGGGFLESVHVIWAPQSFLTSAPPQATCRSLPTGTELSMGSVTLGHGGRAVGETHGSG